jgi:hypothetical protein
VHGIQKRFTLFQAGGFGLQVHGICTEPRGSRTEADARTRGAFEEGQCYSFATQGGELFERMALDFLKGLALVQKKSEFLRGKRLKRQEIVKAIRHIETQATARRVVWESRALLYVEIRRGHKGEILWVVSQLRRSRYMGFNSRQLLPTLSPANFRIADHAGVSDDNRIYQDLPKKARYSTLGHPYCYDAGL